MDNLATIDKPAHFLKDQGILFEINRHVLHPLGLELALTCDEDGELVRLEILDNRTTEGPIFFSSEAFEEGRQKFEQYMAEHGRRNIQKRRQMGMVIQTGPNLPRHFHERPRPEEPTEE
jgi:hypothetical protein